VAFAIGNHSPTPACRSVKEDSRELPLLPKLLAKMETELTTLQQTALAAGVGGLILSIISLIANWLQYRWKRKATADEKLSELAKLSAEAIRYTNRRKANLRERLDFLSKKSDEIFLDAKITSDAEKLKEVESLVREKTEKANEHMEMAEESAQEAYQKLQKVEKVAESSPSLTTVEQMIRRQNIINAQSMKATLITEDTTDYIQQNLETKIRGDALKKKVEEFEAKVEKSAARAEK
jgi:hypothetical protein